MRLVPNATRLVFGTTSDAIFDIVPVSGRNRKKRLENVELAMEPLMKVSESGPPRRNS